MRTLLILALAAGTLVAQVKEFKPSKLNLFSTEQDVELGKEAAAEVRKTMPMVNNQELVNYLNEMGQRLTKSKRAGNFPYTFEVVNDPAINAFALPGGPMFVHTGLIAAADNEAQLAGVLAHEISHVALRHGTNNVTKANLIQLPAMLGAQVLGQKGGILGTLGQLGVTLGAQSILLKYSRGAEEEADLNGAQMMNDAGYDPTEMARFFDKLAAEGGGDNGKLANFLSSHPTPGNRTKYVSEQNKKLPKVNYTANDANRLNRMKQIVGGLPAPPKPINTAVGGGNAGGAGAPSQDVRPNGRYKVHQSSSFEMKYPENWEVFGDQGSSSVTIAPRATLVQDQGGQVHVGYGMIANHFFPQGNNKPNLQRDTQSLIQQLTSGNPQMKQTGNSKSVKVGGQNGLLTPFESPSPYQNMREIDMILTVSRPDALFYVVFIAPDSEWANTQRAFDEAVAGLKFK